MMWFLAGRRLSVLYTASALALLAALAAPAVLAGEPATYGSKTVDEWREDLDFRFDPRVRERAARALGWMGPEAASAVGDLARAVEDDDTSSVRREAAVSLGRMGAYARPAVPALAGAVGDAQEDVALAAIRSLGELGPVAEPAVGALLGVLSERRLALPAIETLGRIGPGARAAIPKLRQLTRGKDGELAEASRVALASIETR